MPESGAVTHGAVTTQVPGGRVGPALHCPAATICDGRVMLLKIFAGLE